MYHATPVRNAASVMRRGLLVKKSKCARATIWLTTPGLVFMAMQHAMKRQRCRPGNVMIIEVDVPKRSLRKGKRERKGLWHTNGADIPPERIVSINFNENWRTDFKGK